MVPDQEFEVNSAGLVLLHPTRAETEVSLELYASSLGAPNSVRKGFDADIVRRTLEVNFFGALRVTDAILPVMPESGQVVMVAALRVT